MKEEWRDIKGYEGLYQVSNLGRVKRLVFSNKVVTKPRERLLALDTNEKGYKKVALSKNGVPSKKQVHRLVAQAFIENPFNKPIVNHKDENPSNNNVNNLEWVTMEENLDYSHVRERLRKFNIEQEKEIISEYLSGKPICKLAEKYNCNQSTLKRMMTRNNIEVRAGHFYSNFGRK